MRWLPPGVSIAVLGLLAVLVPFLRPEQSREEKAIWTAIFFALVVLEIVVIYRERGKHDRDLLNDRRDASNRFDQTIARFGELQATITASAVAVANVRAADAAGVSLTSLKHRSLALADDILRFLVVRQAGDPPLPRPETFEADRDAMVNYFQETMALFSQRFGSKVIAIRNQLAKAGFTDPELDRLYDSPTNPLGIRAVGERIGALAEQLPDA